MENVMYVFGRYQVHYLDAESNDDLVWDEEQRAFLQYGVYNTVMKCYEAYSPVEGAAIMMAIEYQELLSSAQEFLKTHGTEPATVYDATKTPKETTH